MFGIEFIEVVLFVRQLGLAVAGAAALWGFVFWMKARGRSGESRGVFHELGFWLLRPFFVGVFLALLGTAVLLWLYPASALGHEGIGVQPVEAEAVRAFHFGLPLFAALGGLTALGAFFYQRRAGRFLWYLPWFYGIGFVLVSALISLPAWRGAVDRSQLFFAGHGWHSILTLGTVIMVDIVFSFALFFPNFRDEVFSVFPAMSKAIWAGLGIDFLSVGLVFPEALQLTPKFYFMQTVVGVLVINGVFLSGPLTRRLQASVRMHGRKSFSDGWFAVASICGVVSIVSWSMNTFVDFIKAPTLSYVGFLSVYLGAILFGVFVSMIARKHEGAGLS